ncbi:MAG: histidine phosphatase family protein, partial [Candidatus Aminicenantes bacterium]|nr:histidine phosphatase family protein [Candidatus Aminicenantes bacterium]
LVRHGTTTFNEIDQLQGRIDNPLNQKGRAEAARLAARLQCVNLDAIFSSPLQRAIETAAILNSFHNLPLTLIPEFSEIDLGEWEGLNYSQVRAQFPEIHQRWISDPDFPIPGGESFNTVCARTRTGLERILQDNRKHILITGHASVNRAILSNLLQLNPAAARHFRTGNAALSRLLLLENSRQQWAVLDFWNSTSHLENAS